MKGAHINELISQMDHFASDLQHCCMAHQESNTWLDLFDDNLHIAQNAPNPFLIRSTIKYYLPWNNEDAQIRISDIQARAIRTNELLEIGYGELKVQALS